jgi:succinate dehydrogenase / fumarate reductase cytochrome b subunit
VTATPTKEGKRSFFVEFYSSAVGKKWVMAVTGIIVLGYVFVHMFGNLKIYLGTDELGVYAIDHYGEWLRELGEPLLPRTVFLWMFRVILVASFVLHIDAAYRLTLMNRRARPQKYQSPREYLVANYASRTMRWSGVIVGAFILFHLADLTWGSANPDFVRGAVHDNLVASFSRTPVAIFYIVANLLLGMHIFHGAWSLFQSIGWNSPRFNPWRKWFAVAFAAVIVIGNVSFPVSVMAGWVG